MYKIGLKLWSVNTSFYLNAARRLYEEGVFDYIELYVVPETLESLSKWRDFKVPYVIHNAHSMHGFNLAHRGMESRNREIYEQSKRFADALGAQFIIFHGGLGGGVEETARQLAGFREPRALIENKPFTVLPGKTPHKFCRGATVGELEMIMGASGCGFCLDFGHAVCAAASQGVESYLYLKRMMSLKPSMFHLSDVKDMGSPYDAHPHLGSGALDIPRLKKEFLFDGAMISIETEKDSKENLDDFKDDVQWLKNSK